MERKILCGASCYEQKFYLNPVYEVLPEEVRNELKAMCVLFVEDVSGIIMLEFNDEGSLQIMVTAKDDDIYFDEIGSGLKVRQIRAEKAELFRQLEEYYNAVSDRSGEY